jgi:hypothetical protein
LRAIGGPPLSARPGVFRLSVWRRRCSVYPRCLSGRATLSRRLP